MAVNPSGTSSNAKGTNPTSASVTVSAYAFKAFASGRDPLDPAFYGVNRNWRRFSFTYGYDYTKGKEGDPQEKGNIYGIKILPYDKRDVSDPANSKDLRTIADFLMGVGPSEAKAVAKVERDLFNALSDKGRLPADVANETDARKRYNAFRAYLSGDNVLKDLTEALGADALIKLVDDIVAKNIDPDAKFTTAEQAAFDKIRSQPQIAFTFLTKQRKGTRPDEYMAGLTMDLGVMKRWNLTFNGMLNHTNNKLTKNSTGGTFATELQIPLNIVDHLGEHVPWTFSFAASGRWMTKEGPRYQGQAKLTIPFPRMPGVELPFSVSFANRSELLKGKESKVRGHIGFTFDLAKLLTAFKNQLALSPTH